MGASGERKLFDDCMKGTKGAADEYPNTGAESSSGDDNNLVSDRTCETQFMLPSTTLLAPRSWDEDSFPLLDAPTFACPSTLLRGRSSSPKKAPMRSRTLSSQSSVPSLQSLSPGGSRNVSAQGRQPLDAVGDGLRRFRRERHRQAALSKQLSAQSSGEPQSFGGLLAVSLLKMTAAGLLCTSSTRRDEYQEEAQAIEESCVARPLGPGGLHCSRGRGRSSSAQCADDGASGFHALPCDAIAHTGLIDVLASGGAGRGRSPQ